MTTQPRYIPGSLSSRATEIRLVRGRMTDAISYIERIGRSEIKGESPALHAKALAAAVTVAEYLEAVMLDTMAEGDQS